MSQTTRINRPTYATPRNTGTRRFIHVSTRYGWAELPRTGVPGRFIKMLDGVTYRRKREAT